MSAVLIDYGEIITNGDKIKSVLSTAPSKTKGFVPGLILIVRNGVLNKLSGISPGKKRVEYINTDEFINSIDKHYYVMYNDKRKICLMGSECEKDLSAVLNALFSGFSSDTLIWVSLSLDENNFSESVKLFAENGFNSPYVTTLSPLYGDIPVSAALSRQNIPSDPHKSKATLNKVFYAIEQFKKGGNLCYLYAKFSPRAIGFLKEASKIGIVVGKDGKKSQRELTGELYVKDVIREGGDFVYVIDIDKGSVESGEEENVDVSATRYNFHSHPREAYVRHSVEKAWPSVTDYMGYHRLGKNTIFHCVATLEGVYVVSFTSYWGPKLEKVSRKFIDKNFEIDHKEPYTPEEYVEKINGILYEGYPIFEVKYFSWKNIGGKFKVFYPQIGSSCLPSQQIVDKYNRLHV